MDDKKFDLEDIINETAESMLKSWKSWLLTIWKMILGKKLTLYIFIH